MINKLLKWLQGKEGEAGKSKKPSKKTGYIMIIGLIGLLLLIVSNLFTSSTEKPEPDQQLKIEEKPETSEVHSNSASSTSDVDELQASYKKDLEKMLENIQGVSEPEVMINLDSTNVKVYEKNLIKTLQTTDENDRNGGTRQIEENTEETEVVLVRQGDKETPLLIQTKKPEVRGVFVVAKGVDHATVKQWVVEAISRVLDVPTHRVSVLPKK